MSDIAFIKLIDVIYKAPFETKSEAEGWECVAQIIERYFPFSRVTFAFYNSELTYIDPEAVGISLLENHAREEGCFAAIAPWKDITTQSWLGRTLTRGDGVDTRDYKKVRLPLKCHADMDQAIGAVFLREANHLGVLGIQYHSGFMDDDEISHLVNLTNLLCPHLRRAFKWRGRMREVEHYALLLEMSIQKFGHGALILSKSGKVILVNDAAKAIIAEAPFLSLTEERKLNCSNTHLQNLICKMLTLPGTGEVELSPTLSRIKGNGTHHDIIVALVRLKPGAHCHARTSWGTIPDQPHMFMLLFDPTKRNCVPDDILQSVLGITSAEAKLAIAIEQGLTLNEYADNNDLSRNTVRNQMQSILQKTGLRKQAELLRLITLLFGSVNLQP